MRKITSLMGIAFLSAITICSCTGNKAPETNTEIVAKKSSEVEIIYFHGKQRCATCMAIEKEATALVESELAQQVKDGKVAFRIVDISTEEGKKVAEQYKVSYSSLFVVTKGGAEDLTRFAFTHARSNGESFRQELKNKVLKAME